MSRRGDGDRPRYKCRRRAPPNLSRHAEALATQYALSDGFYRLRVRDRSPLIGQDPARVDLGGHADLAVVAVQSPDGGRAGEIVAANDVLVVTGPTDQVSTFVVDAVLAVAMTPLPEHAPGELSTREAGVAELEFNRRLAVGKIGELVLRDPHHARVDLVKAVDVARPPVGRP